MDDVVEKYVKIERRNELERTEEVGGAWLSSVISNYENPQLNEKEN